MNRNNIRPLKEKKRKEIRTEIAELRFVALDDKPGKKNLYRLTNYFKK